MCTVSIVPRADGFRVVCNRDERRTRPRALTPLIHTAPSTTSVWPVDPVSGGTWIGANDAGLVLVLLNRANPTGRHESDLSQSRGTIIPQVLENYTLEMAINASARLDVSRFEPYTLVALQHRSGISITMTSSRPVIRSHDLARPHLFTSSSVEEGLAANWRRALFIRLVESSVNMLDGQATFHRHRWAARPDISVRMTRSDASTVSITTIDASNQRIRMCYADLGVES